MPRAAIGDGSVIDVGIDVDPRDQEIESLRAENRRLQRAVSDSKLEAQRAREDADRALSNLRRLLNPWYRALQIIYGELDDAGVTDTAPATATAAAVPSAVDGRLKAIWDNWKVNLPGYPARVIDALLLHADMNTSQLAIACGCKPQRISEAMVKLNKAGLINKNGGRFSLKQL